MVTLLVNLTRKCNKQLIQKREIKFLTKKGIHNKLAQR